MTVPSTLTTADVLRLLPALEKWDRDAAIRIAHKIPGSIVEWFRKEDQTWQGPATGHDADCWNVSPIEWATRVRVTIPSEVVTRELGHIMHVVQRYPGIYLGHYNGSNPTYTYREPRPAIVISTEGGT